MRQLAITDKPSLDSASYASISGKARPNNTTWSRSYPIIVCAFLSLALNIWLVRDNVKLRSAIDLATGLKIGERVAPFDLKDSEGKKLHISYSVAPRGLILYYFSPNCRWCMRNGPNLNALSYAVGNRYQIVSYATDLHGLAGYVAKTKHNIQVATDDSVNIRELLRLSGTPQTIVFDSNGVVISNWRGAYVGRIFNDVERHFQVKLPGLLDNEKLNPLPALLELL